MYIATSVTFEATTLFLFIYTPTIHLVPGISNDLLYLSNGYENILLNITLYVSFQPGSSYCLKSVAGLKSVVS